MFEDYNEINQTKTYFYRKVGNGFLQQGLRNKEKRKK